MSDPLTKLRECHLHGSKDYKWDQQRSEIVIDGERFPLLMPTRFLSAQEIPLTVGALYYIITTASKPASEFLREANQSPFGSRLGLADRRTVLSYLQGQKTEEEIQNIVRTDAELQARLATTAATADTTSTAPSDSALLDTTQTTSATAATEGLVPLPAELKQVGLTAEDMTARESFLEYLTHLRQPQQMVVTSEAVPGEATQLASEMGLSAGALEAIRQKRALQKRQQTGSEVAVAPPTLAPEVNSWKKRMDPITKQIIARERCYHDRKSILQSKNRVRFDKLCDKILEDEDSQRRKAQEAAKSSSSSSSRDAKKQSAPSGYDRYAFDENMLWKEKVGVDDEFQIDTRGTFAPSTFHNMLSGGASGSGGSSSAAASASRYGGNTDKKRSRDDMTGGSSTAAATTPAKVPKLAPGTLDPIIAVPPWLDMKATLNLRNALKFIQDGDYAAPAEVTGAKPGPRVTFERQKKDGSKVTYTIADMSKLSEKDWIRVIAVFVTGTPYQFKSCPVVPPKLFAQARGFFLYYDDDKLPETVLGWNVRRLTVNKSKRHLDKSSSVEFWKEIDSWVPVNRADVKV